MTTDNYPLVFELSKAGRVGYSLPELDVEETDLESIIGSTYLRKEAPSLPEISELQLIRHYTNLSKRNYGVDSGFYPLGSCTMKYNPKMNEDVARLEGLSHIHPYQDVETVQGALAIMYDLQTSLEEITGMHRFTLQTAAGAHGEWTGLMMIRAFHEKNGDYQRTKVIIPDSAHGTNPASAAVAGFDPVTVQTNEQGLVDLDDLRRVVGKDTAALMLTNPNTLGLFEKEIVEIAGIVHDAGGKLYYDGANLNAIMGYTRPGDMGFDVVHLNLHKTFTGPHGGGGPGSGPVGVSEEMEKFLPKPILMKQEDMFVFEHNRPDSIGRVKPYFGNFGINIRAYTYIRTMGAEGLKKASTYAVLNANYLMRRLQATFALPYPQHCKHEFVLSGKKQKKLGVRTLDIAKRLLDYGYHPPTIYFPLNVAEAMMIEPTETETKETLDAFIDALLAINQEAIDQPDLVQEAPYATVVKRMDETLAARKPIVKYAFHS
ncbi:putative glycine dehydrogenase (decarboxylating) subunit 2 [Paraliobacillus sp. PM-2]|uniref:aminomethyl-transferring glycine dehydrogenase subunit GcvPB n=1 Tax=Paraliobacillus sp. PM-2 TaxID=1462524 RepID=UPI00061C97A5|nr:aminomethyl-transferring glycine dehydrogenase subunit GcvPB [Paraliobacillus sp. PM-2]CQR46826.1 putative glycine dehydrogenase (decarboxylating) subunit 2 [Paraliobacillus sp. PM-2]